jgi:hypothetical protein
VTDVALVRAASHERLASVLGYGVSADLVGRLAQSSRLRMRLTSLIASRMGKIGELDREQARILAMSPDQLTDLSMRAGAVWHAAAILRIVDGVSRRILVARLGEKNYQLGLAFRSLQPPGTTLDRAPGEIAQAVPADGAACLAAWCESQPPAVAGRLRLTRPAASPEPAHLTWGPPIIAGLLGDD